MGSASEYWNRFVNWSKEQLTSGAEAAVRLVEGDDLVDFVKFLHKEEPDLDQKIVQARQGNEMFAKIYDDVFQYTKEEIGSKADSLPSSWKSAAELAGIPVNQLTAQIKKNGAQKMAYAITDAVISELPSKAWYTGNIAGDVYANAKKAAWKEPTVSFKESPWEWIMTMLSNVFHLVTELFSGFFKTDLNKKGEELVMQDVSNHAEEIIGKVCKKLAGEMGMPANPAAADKMVDIYVTLKQKTDPGFSLDRSERTRLKQEFLNQMREATSPPPAAPATSPPTILASKARGTPVPCEEADASTPVKPTKTPSATTVSTSCIAPSH